MTVVRSDPDKDRGDPKEQITRYDRDPWWDDEIEVFADSIVNDTPVQNSVLKDALRNMHLVFLIYYSNAAWRKTYRISDPHL